MKAFKIITEQYPGGCSVVLLSAKEAVEAARKEIDGGARYVEIKVIDATEEELGIAEIMKKLRK